MSPRTMKVTISGLYSVYDVPDNKRRWNGFAVPGFTVDQVHQLVGETNQAASDPDIGAAEVDTISIDTQGVVSVRSGTYDTTTVVESDQKDGLFYVGAYEWAWEIVED